MTGIMSAVVGTGQNIIYVPGLVRRQYFGYAGTNTAFFDNASPFATDINSAPAQVSYSGSGNFSVLWVGYYRPASAGNSTFTVSPSFSDANNYNYLWVGSQAKSGYNSGNARIVGSGSASVSLLAGHYYPIRIQLAYDGQGGFFDDPSLFFNLVINGSTSYSVFYNSLTTGF
jgi:hypothetical protein